MPRGSQSGIRGASAYLFSLCRLFPPLDNALFLESRAGCTLHAEKPVQEIYVQSK